ncbi:hypothetical protein H4R33_006226 [Dimargaris cristalligena]|nr:hypothetical protein H4R33_006226 [Dimargaris cristalligena]
MYRTSAIGTRYSISPTSLAHRWVYSLHALNTGNRTINIEERNVDYLDQLRVIMARRHLAVRLYYVDYNASSPCSNPDTCDMALCVLYDPRGLTDAESGERMEQKVNEIAIEDMTHDRDISKIVAIKPNDARELVQLKHIRNRVIPKHNDLARRNRQLRH